MERHALSASDDDDDDRENLIDQNERKHPAHLHPPSSPSAATRHRFSAFEMDAPSIRRRLAVSFSKKRHYYVLLAISLPLFVVLAFFSADIKSLFSSTFTAPSSSLNGAAVSAPLFNRMQESELRALFLLRRQQDALLSLYGNRSSGNYGNVPREELESAVLNQILLNKQIQEVLLAAHRSDYPGNSSNSEGVTADYWTCSRVGGPLAAGRGRVEWRPRPGKFLFPICLSGQMSNHLICLQKHMFFAAVMDRVLVIPSPHFDYLYSRVIDIEHINECVNGGKEKFVVSFDEFVQLRKNRPHIDRFYCYFAKPVPCYVDEDHIKKLKGIGVSVSVSVSGKMETPFVNEDVKKPGNRSLEEVKEKFGGVGEDVVVIGDVFFANVEGDWLMQPSGPIAHRCKTLIEPSKLIVLTAQRFVQTFLGRDFIALHFRRHGWLKFCNAKKPSCFYSVPQAADCIAQVVAKTNAPVIYLSTDAAESETGLLQSLLIVNGKAVPLVKRPPPNSAEKWDALLYRHHIEDDGQVEAMLDKTICAMSTVFIGASGSTFTEDILRIRKDWGTASSCDEYLCQGESPNFIADDE